MRKVKFARWSWVIILSAVLSLGGALLDVTKAEAG